MSDIPDQLDPGDPDHAPLLAEKARREAPPPAPMTQAEASAEATRRRQAGEYRDEPELYRLAYGTAPAEPEATPTEVLRTREHWAEYDAPLPVEDAALDRDIRSFGKALDMPRRVLVNLMSRAEEYRARVGAMTDEEYRAADEATLARLAGVWHGATAANLDTLREVLGQHPAIARWAAEVGLLQDVEALREVMPYLRRERNWRVAELSYARHGHTRA